MTIVTNNNKYVYIRCKRTHIFKGFQGHWPIFSYQVHKAPLIATHILSGVIWTDKRSESCIDL